MGPLDSGNGPLPPVKGVTPIPSMQSGAPNALGPRPQGQNAPSLEPGGPQPFPQGSIAAQPQAQPAPQVQQPTPQAPPRQQSQVGQIEPSPPVQPLGHYEGYHEDAFSKAYEDPPVVQHKSVEGFVKNLGDDVQGFVAGIPAAFKVAWQSGSQLTGNLRWVDDLYQHPEYLSKELANTWTHVIKGFTDTYKDGIGEALYKHPFSVFMDATTVADIVGGGIKAAGKAAMTGAERLALEEGRLTGGIGERIVQLGDRVQRFPGDAIKAPFKAAGDLALKVPMIKSFAEAKALTPLGFAENDRMKSMLLNGQVEAAQRMDQVIEAGLSPSQKAEYWQIRDGYKPQEFASDPELVRRANEWRQMNLDNENWMTQSGSQSAEALAAAELKPLAQRLYEEALARGEPVGDLVDFKTGQWNKQWLDRAAAWKSGDNPWRTPTIPSYHPFFGERSMDLAEIFNAMQSDANMTQYMSRMEKKGIMNGNIHTEPDLVEARAELQISYLRSMVNYMADNTFRNGKVVKMGSAVPAGHVLMDPLLIKYIEGGLINSTHAMAVNFANELRAAVPGKTLFESLQDSYAKTAKTIDEMGAWKDLKEAAADPKAWQIAIPRETAYLIESQLKGVTGPLRFYDKMLNTWRNVVLRLMPRFYLNQLLGHSTLLLFGSHLPFVKSMALNEKVLPGEAVSSAGIQLDAGFHNDLTGYIPGMKSVTKFTDLVNEQTGSVPRQLLSNTKAQEILEREAEIGNVTAKAMLAGNTAEEAVNQGWAARKELQQLGGKQLLAAKAAVDSGEFQKLEAMLSGEQKHVFTPEQEARTAQINGQLKDLETQIAKEQALSNATVPTLTPDGVAMKGPVDVRVANLRTQMGLLSDELEKLGKPLGRAEWVAEDMPHLKELQEMSARREYLAPRAELMDRAVKMMEQFLGNYGRLHPMESEVVRRIIPFWTFQKTMGKLLLNLPIVSPKTSFLWNQYAKFMIDAANDDRLPGRYRNYIPIGHAENPDGDVDTIGMKIDGFSPFRDLGMTTFGGMSIPKQLDPMQNPLIKFGVESMGGYDNFTDKPFTQPTDFVTLNGSIWRFDPATQELKQVVPQKPIIDSLFNQLPHMKVVLEALDSFDKTRPIANAISKFTQGSTVTPQNAEGQYTYNRHWWWAASRAFGFPVHVANPEKVEMMHDNMVRNMIQRFYGEMHRVDPDTQAKLEHILEDLGNGAWKLREWGD